MRLVYSATGFSEELKGLAANTKISTVQASSVEEARILVRRCAEPCQAGESIKSALRRVTHRLQFSHIRTRALWYGEARRIDAREMDRLREVADEIELFQAVSAIETLIARIGPSASLETKKVVTDLTALLDAASPDSLSTILGILRTRKTTSLSSD
jgi:hypothetical protein